jgi:DNA repair exonuclease SbcCD ATPase subunit
MKYNGQGFEKLLKANEERKKVLATHIEKANKQLEDLNNIKERSLSKGDHDSYIEADIKTASVKDYIEQLKVRAEQEQKNPYTMEELKEVAEECVKGHRVAISKAESKVQQAFTAFKKVWEEFEIVKAEHDSDVGTISGYATVIEPNFYRGSGQISTRVDSNLLHVTADVYELIQRWQF